MLFHRFSKDVILPAGYKIVFGKKSFDRVLCGNSNFLDKTRASRMQQSSRFEAQSVHSKDI
ncbi:hypothetical protein BK187_03930 [Brucella melitensis]|nr:hypothetical protein BK187_03930 [Brucella melitensis]ARY27525.1 hypothetical protein BK219_03930 [Brucella melitensis]ARY37001.1 hypothetical protein BK217_03935 [Brucella melitensis]HAQ29452.1 hypothetical protein [Brucella melitensis]HBW75017.1 hypothetical protein [Brucella melitensis]